MGSNEEPYDKKKRKQKMTAEQLAQLYAKQPRIQYDSDDEPIRCGTPQHVRHARAAAVEAMAPVNFTLSIPQGGPTSTVHYNGAQYSPTQRDAVWELELLAAIDSQRVSSGRPYRPSNRSLFADSVDGESPSDEGTDETSSDPFDPDRIVQDPFCPEVTCTASERDARLEDEQEYRCECGLSLLVQDPTDPEHWIEPPLECVAVPVDVGEETGDFPVLQATPVAEITCSPEPQESPEEHV